MGRSNAEPTIRIHLHVYARQKARLDALFAGSGLQSQALRQFMDHWLDWAEGEAGRVQAPDQATNSKPTA